MSTQEQMKKQADGCASLLIIIGIALAVGYCTTRKSDPPPAQLTAAEEAENTAKGLHCLSVWDGSNADLVKKVKQNLRDPSSFEHMETIILPVENGKHAIMMKYRARNGFNGFNLASTLGSVDAVTCNATVISTEP